MVAQLGDVPRSVAEHDLAARTDVPLVGDFFVYPQVALAMSWAGFLHALLVAPLLLWRRRQAYG